MKYYFDQRDSKNVNVFIYVDDEYYGKIYANEACVTSVELPDEAKRIRLSFSDAFTSIDRVKSNTSVGDWDLSELDDDQSGAFLEDDSDDGEEAEIEAPVDPDLLESVAYQDMHFGYEDFVTIPYDGMSNRRWQFPYDVEIDISVYPGDLVFYPAAFERREVDGGIYYQGRTVENCNLIEMKLKKRIQVFDIETKRKLYLGLSVICFLVCIAALSFRFHEYITEYWPNREYYNNCTTYYVFWRNGEIGFYVVGIIGSVYNFINKWKYKGIFIEKDMKDEYLVTAEGKVVDA